MSDEAKKIDTKKLTESVMEVLSLVHRAYNYYNIDPVFKEKIGIPIVRPYGFIKWVLKVLDYEKKLGGA